MDGTHRWSSSPMKIGIKSNHGNEVFFFKQKTAYDILVGDWSSDVCSSDSKHGIGQIVAVEKDTIAGIEIHFYKIEITKDKLVLTIPTNQQNHLRPLSSINQINKAISILKGKAKVKRTMWSRRAQEYEQKINSGEIYQIAEVVRDLNKNTDMPVDQSYSERQLFEKAFERLLGEVTVVLGSTEEEAKEKLNKALGKKTEENLVT